MDNLWCLLMNRKYCVQRKWKMCETEIQKRFAVSMTYGVGPLRNEVKLETN